MKGKCKKILSLALVLAMAVQLFSGLGNVAQAEEETVTSLTITGRFTSCDGTSPVQIGFSVDKTIEGGGNWPNGFLHSGNLELNGEPQNTDDWRFQATGTNTMNMVCQNYTPTAGDLITIPAGTQIRCDSLLYEFSNRFSVKYDGTTWNALDFADIYFAVTGRFTDCDGASPVQIGFSVDKTIEGGGNWPNGFLHSGNLELNGEPQNTDDWRFQATGTNTMNMVCQNYTPTAGDLITIPLGTQVRCNGILYEFTNEFSVTYNGTAWNEVKQPDVSFAITGRYTGFDATNPIQIGFAVDGTIEGGGDWPNGTITQGSVTLNGAGQSGWTLQATGTSMFNLVCWDYTPAVNDIITMPASLQFTCNGKLYEITNEYMIQYNGTTWVEYVAVTDITINGLDGSHTPAAGETPEQIGFAISGTLTDGGNWNNCLITEGSVLLNGVAQSEWKIQTTATDAFNLVCWSYTPVKNDIVKIPAGTQFTDQANGSIYEISNDYSIKYDGTSWSAYVEPDATITITGPNGSRTPAAGETPEQIGFAITGTLTDGGNWNNCLITEGSVLLNGVAQSEWKIQTTATNAFNLVCWSYTPAVKDIITIPAGTRFTDQANGNVYEITNESVIRYDGIKWIADVEADVDLTLGELITSRCVRKEASKGYVYQLYIKTDHFDAPAAWTGNDNNATIYLNGEPVSGAVTWDDVANGILFVQLDLTKDTAVDSITLAEGTQYTINNLLYEIAEDYTIYHKNGTFSSTMLYDITKIIDGTTTVETVTGDYTLPETIEKEGYITLGWKVNEALYKVGTTLTEKAEGYTIEAVYAEFSQLKGAQVRVSTANEKEKVGGIRFVCKLAKNSISDYITQMGVLVMPTDYMTAGLEFTHDNYEKQTENYGTVKGYREFTLNKEDMKLGTIDSGNDETSEEAYYLKAAIVNLYSYNYTRSYSARSFLAVQYAGEEEPTYVYTDYSKENNARRICDIAKKMIETDPDEYGPTESKYPIVYDYAKVADTMGSFAFFGPKAVVTDGVYDEEATINAMKTYANMGFQYLLMDDNGYHVDLTYFPSTEEEERTLYEEYSGSAARDLKKTMECAEKAGLDVIVLDLALMGLSKSDESLVETESSKDQVIAMCLEVQLSDGTTIWPELHGTAIDEENFNTEKSTYSYTHTDGNTYEANVLHYAEQFETEEALKEWVRIKMSAYANEDNFRGVRLVDEPRVGQYAAVAMMTKVIKALYPDAYVQSSNLQSYSTVYDSDYATWSEAWDKLLQTNTEATEVGINFYPYRKGNSFWGALFGSNYELQKNYLSSLQKLAQTTKDKGLDLELTIQSYATEAHYHTVSANRLALQSHLALAFGTETLGYFRYTGTGLTESEANSKITQTIDSDENLSAAVLYANRNANYLKSHMTFFEYQDSKVLNQTNNAYVTLDNYTSGEFAHDIIQAIDESAPILCNQFYNQYTKQYGYYVVNLAELHDKSNGDDISNDPITITLSKECVVYQDYKQYAYDADKNEEVTNKVTSITLSDGQGAFIVVD